MKTIGSRIREKRLENNKTLDDVARITSSTKQTIYKYENDLITNIPNDKLEKIANYLNTSPSYLFGWDDFDEMTNKIVNDQVTFENQLSSLGWNCEHDDEEYETDEYDIPISDGHYLLTKGQITLRIPDSDFVQLLEENQTFLMNKLQDLVNKTLTMNNKPSEDPLIYFSTYEPALAFLQSRPMYGAGGIQLEKMEPEKVIKWANDFYGMEQDAKKYID